MEEISKLVSISLGSNLGNKEQNLSFAINQLEDRVGKVLITSDFLIIEPQGFFSENSFINCCCVIITKLSILELISITQRIEIEMGRSKLKINEYEDRLIDIDIIFYADEVFNHKNVRIPHIHFRKRDFVLLPLKQISDKIDPETFISIHQFTK